MPRYLLDADTISSALRGQGHVGARLRERRPSELCLSAITLAELNFGAESRRSQRLRQAIQAFTRAVEVLPFDEAAAERFGIVAAQLASKGRPMGVVDTLVAAHALSRGFAVVTNNVRRFSQVAGLKVESWA